MPKVNAAMKGIFKEMLDDYLRVVAEQGGRQAGRGAGRAAGREAAQAAVSAADEVASKVLDVPFKVSKRMSGHRDELVRQLERQLKAFDGMTPRQILDRMENTAKRTGKAQKEARERFAKQMNKRQDGLVRQLQKTDPDAFARQMKDFDLTPSGNPFTDAKNLAEARTNGFMDTVAALHEPDIVAGGADVIGRNGTWDSFGLSNVNSSIGSQWKSLKPDLVNVLRGLDPDTPIRLVHEL